MYSLFSTAIGPLSGARSDVRDVQERWLDAKEEHDAHERVRWRREGAAVAEASSRAQAVQTMETARDSEGQRITGGIASRTKVIQM